MPETITGPLFNVSLTSIYCLSSNLTGLELLITLELIWQSVFSLVSRLKHQYLAQQQHRLDPMRPLCVPWWVSQTKYIIYKTCKWFNTRCDLYSTHSVRYKPISDNHKTDEPMAGPLIKRLKLPTRQLSSSLPPVPHDRMPPWGATGEEGRC